MKQEKLERGQEDDHGKDGRRVTRGDEKERSNMERGRTDRKGKSEVESSLEPPLH